LLDRAGQGRLGKKRKSELQKFPGQFSGKDFNRRAR
jgi:hypothetical protein